LVGNQFIIIRSELGFNVLPASLKLKSHGVSIGSIQLGVAINDPRSRQPCGALPRRIAHHTVGRFQSKLIKQLLEEPLALNLWHRAQMVAVEVQQVEGVVLDVACLQPPSAA
jgi:hypothetical protein